MYKTKQQKWYKPIDDIITNHAFWAFSNQQLQEQLAKRNLTLDNLKQNYVKFCSGMLHKDYEKPLIKAYKAYNSKIRHNILHDYKFAYSAFMYQMNNYEYGYTQDLKQIREALNISTKTLNKTRNV